MCGIVVCEDGNINLYLDIIQHRGRDERKIVSYEGLDFGFNRLAIKSLKQGSQPIEDENYIVMFNGELYNYDKKFDSEIEWLLYLVNEYKDWYKLVDGQYFIVVYDKKKNKLMLLRDLLGIIPGYFKLNPLLVISENRVKGVQEVKPNTLYEIDLDSGKISKSEVERLGIYNYKFNQKVMEGLIRDTVEVVAEHTDVGLSIGLGGLDSALIAKIVADKGYDVDIFTVGFCNDSEDVYYAEKFADEIGIKINTYVLDEQEILSNIERYKQVTEGIMPEFNEVKFRGFLRNYYVAKHSAKKVILVGEGSDELFGGYPFFRNLEGSSLLFRRLTALGSMHVINLDRVDRAGMWFTKEYRPVYLCKPLIRGVLGYDFTPGKLELRRIARDVGVPAFMFQRRKYGNDEKYINKLVERLKARW